MAVVTVWKCDRDGAMFDNKKDSAEKIGLVLAKRRDALAKACKGKPDVLLEEITQKEETAGTQPEPDNLTQLSEVS